MSLIFWPLTVYAQDEQLLKRIEALEKGLSEAREWRTPLSNIHLAGYADAGYVQVDKGGDNFTLGNFAPIFHYQYQDIILLESELEMEIEADGETSLGLEYLSLDYFINDTMVLLVGKFVSPIGRFRQNLHPSWINKMASAPVGFGHDGAAPITDLGAQLRGGFFLGNLKMNYSIFASNGPQLKSVFEDGEYELEGVQAEAFGADFDGKKVYGGRLGANIIDSMELGLSYAGGKATVSAFENAGVETDVTGESPRDYSVMGADLTWFHRGFMLLGEYVSTNVGEATTGTTASEEAKWTTWYSQISYRWNPTKWETALRFTSFDSPHSSEDQEQWALGINYWFTNNFVGKVTYEFNNGVEDTSADADRALFQLAYGF